MRAARWLIALGAAPALAHDEPTALGPAALELTPPAYGEAFRAGLQAECLVRFTLDDEGAPQAPTIEAAPDESCDELFHEPLREAAAGWRFVPPEVDRDAPPDPSPEPPPATLYTQAVSFELWGESGEPEVTFPSPLASSAPANYTTLPSVKVRRDPTYPIAARELGLEAGCQARLHIDATGRVQEVEIANPESCPKIFHESVNTALSGWRFYPAKVDGEAAPSHVVQLVRFKLMD